MPFIGTAGQRRSDIGAGVNIGVNIVFPCSGSTVYAIGGEALNSGLGFFLLLWLLLSNGCNSCTGVFPFLLLL